MDFAYLVSGDNWSGENIDGGFISVLADREHPWNQSPADGSGAVHLLILWSETTAAFAGSDWFLSLVLRRRLRDRVRLFDGHPRDEPLKVSSDH